MVLLFFVLELNAFFLLLQKKEELNRDLDAKKKLAEQPKPGRQQEETPGAVSFLSLSSLSTVIKSRVSTLI